MSLLSMRWRDVLFAHWPVAPVVVEERLPDSLAVDTFDGRAWLGVVPFYMTDIRPRFSPIGLSFPELNLRTYVQGEKPGVYFFNLDADDRLGVTLARRFFELPYYRAEMDVDRGGDAVDFESRRVHPGVPSCRFDATYRPGGEPFRASDRDLTAFLTERYRFYTTSDDGTRYYGDIAHESWPMRDAEADLRENDLFSANGFDRPESEPRFHYSPGIDVTAERIRRG